jgi:hypothetical protein
MMVVQAFVHIHLKQLSCKQHDSVSVLIASKAIIEDGHRVGAKPIAIEQQFHHFLVDFLYRFL